MRIATPRLVPGLLALRRSREEVQVGLHHPHRLRDSREVRQVLDETTGLVARAADPAVLDDLVDHGLLLDPVTATVLRPPHGTPEQRRTARDLAASALRHGPDVQRARTARSRGVALRSHGPAARDVAADVGALLRSVGAGGLDGPVEPDDDVPVLVVSDGEPPRELVDDLVRDRRAHLLLRLLEGTVVLGPWVEPGLTACLRCEDLHRTATDPAWPLLVAQAARLGAEARADDVATPADALAVAAAAATAARDLVRAAEGARPATWSRELRWGHAADRWPAREPHDDVVARSLVRHAACACTCWEVATGAVTDAGA